MSRENDIAAFIALCTDLTGFSAFHLRGTGLVEHYLELMLVRAGASVTTDLLAAHGRARSESADDAAALARIIRRLIMSDARLGPPARSLLKLWYAGVWRALPSDWHDAHGGALDDTDVVPTPASYTEGLLWPTVGANPPGAKPFGYGMWATAPRIPNPVEA